MTGRIIKRKSTEKMYALVAKGDTKGLKKVVIAEHNRCQKKYLNFLNQLLMLQLKLNKKFLMKEILKYRCCT